jgi:hypothetical protein
MERVKRSEQEREKILKKAITLKNLGKKIFSTEDGKEFALLAEEIFGNLLAIDEANYLENKEMLSFILGARHFYNRILFGNYPDSLKLLLINKKNAYDR